MTNVVNNNIPCIKMINKMIKKMIKKNSKKLIIR